MKNTIFIVAGLLLISSFVTIGLGQLEAGDKQTELNLTFSDLIIKNSNDEQYVELSYNEAQGVIYQAGAPILPKHSTKMTFPFGTKITSIECKTGEVKSMVLDKKITLAPNPVLQDIVASSKIVYDMDETIYDSEELYPNSWFDYTTGGGLDENLDHASFLIIQSYPVRYNPAKDTIYYIDNIDITISYQLPESTPFASTTETQMVIITPQKFQSKLQELVTHKNSHGISTVIKTTEEIYSQYSGVDKPEQIKMYIKDALETMNIQYVMLVGGINSYIYGHPRENRNYGAKDWNLPVRYTNLRETTGSTYDPGFISDLYYADIYDSEGNFSSWDSNHDGIYAKWDNTPGKDVIDFYPDVSLGRLACRNTWEVGVMVKKIITYETTTSGSSWGNKIIVVGGDSFDDVGTNYIEGEIVSDYILTNYMTEYSPVKLYASFKTSNPSYVPTTKNLIREISKGAGFLLFDGHANPLSWITHYPGEFDGWIPEGGIKVNNFPSLSNRGKYPICYVEGCHNSQFNVSMIWNLKDLNQANKYHTFCYGTPIPKCWSWWLASKVNGGSIATIGNTGLGYGAVGEHGDLDEDGITEPDVIEALGGYFMLNFFKSVDENYNYLGQAWSMTVTNYLNTFPGMKSQTDAKTVEQLPLLGDPSLMIGGYS